MLAGRADEVLRILRLTVPHVELGCSGFGYRRQLRLRKQRLRESHRARGS
jgi:hypothetical protein